MHFEKVIFAFLIILALCLNVSFVYGEISNPAHHHSYELAAALIITLIGTVLKFGDRSNFGATVLASSLVTVLMLVAAATALFYSNLFESAEASMATTISLAMGALVANFLSVILLLVETSQLRK